MLNLNQIGSTAQQERSPNKSWGRRWLSLAVIKLVSGSLLGMAIPTGQAFAGNSYQTCAEEMLNVGISSEIAADVCAGAFKPDNLSACVTKIYDSRIEVSPPSILFNCQRVRRPKELATCVVDILKNIPDASSEIVIENCRRSLLPKRYASCAIGLYEELGLSSTDIFASCLNPKDVVSIELR